MLATKFFINSLTTSTTTFKAALTMVPSNFHCVCQVFTIIFNAPEANGFNAFPMSTMWLRTFLKPGSKAFQSFFASDSPSFNNGFTCDQSFLRSTVSLLIYGASLLLPLRTLRNLLKSDLISSNSRYLISECELADNSYISNSAFSFFVNLLYTNW